MAGMYWFPLQSRMGVDIPVETLACPSARKKTFRSFLCLAWADYTFRRFLVLRSTTYQINTAAVLSLPSARRRALKGAQRTGRVKKEVYLQDLQAASKAGFCFVSSCSSWGMWLRSCSVFILFSVLYSGREGGKAINRIVCLTWTRVLSPGRDYKISVVSKGMLTRIEQLIGSTRSIAMA